MKKYTAIFGASVRMYADDQFDAASDQAATAHAIREFKEHGSEFGWTDAHYNNLALPTIVALRDIRGGREILEGHDFAATASDAWDLASRHLLASLKELVLEIAQEIEQRRNGGNAEDWIGLQQKSDRAHAAIRAAETVNQVRPLSIKQEGKEPHHDSLPQTHAWPHRSQPAHG